MTQSTAPMGLMSAYIPPHRRTLGRFRLATEDAEDANVHLAYT